MEKSYRGWKMDIDRNISPLEAGFERFIAIDKGDFTGREALLRERALGAGRQIVTVTLDDAGDAEPPPMAVIWHGGRRTGLVTSAAYGHAIRASLALALVERGAANSGTSVEVEMFGQMKSARIIPESPYNPTHSLLRG